MAVDVGSNMAYIAQEVADNNRSYIPAGFLEKQKEFPEKLQGKCSCYSYL